MKIGVCIVHHRGMDIFESMKNAAELGFDNCQLVTWEQTLWTQEEADTILAASRQHNITISAVWVGWSGPRVWDFYEGYETLGLLPVAYRFARMQDLCNGSDFAKLLGVRDIVTHVGFIPENPYDPNYASMVSSIKAVAKHVEANGQRFLFETGQETPVTLLRAMEDIGCENLGVNLDPANLILYGKGNPVDAIDTLGPYIMGVHAKDGVYPTDGKHLGKETAIGDGKVNFPALIKALKDAGYTGTLTIEREISGPQQTADIVKGKALLESYIAQLA